VANRTLRQFLQWALTISRHHFAGAITYGSGSWESVAWADFDAVGVNSYRDARNRAGYAHGVARLQRHGKPVIITEFGCCTHKGADARGADGDDIADWDKPVPQIRPGHVRDEDVQANYLAESLEIYTANGVHGAFVFEFIETMYPHSPDPRYDLDMACFGIVKVHLPDIATGGGEQWEPKAAFHRLATLYAAQEVAENTGATTTSTSTSPSVEHEQGPRRAAARKPLSDRLWDTLGTVGMALGVGYGAIVLNNVFYGFLIGVGAVALVVAVHLLLDRYQGRRHDGRTAPVRHRQNGSRQ
jgi:hypothetical protein